MAPLTGKRVAIRLQDKDQGEGQGTRHAFPTLVRREPRANAAQEVPNAVLVELAPRGGLALRFGDYAAGQQTAHDACYAYLQPGRGPAVR